MSKNIRVIFVILSVVFIVFTYRIISFYNNDKTVMVRYETESPTISHLGNNYYSFASDGQYGVKNSNGKVIIEARWKSIDRVGSDHFAASVMTQAGIRYGIIDSSEDIVVPFVYKAFEKSSKEVIFAETPRGKYVLFDYCGNTIINGEWDKITKNYQNRPLSAVGNFIQLEKDRELYRISKNSDGNWVMKEIRFLREIQGEKRLVKINNTAVSPGLSNTGLLYAELFDCSAEYIDALFSSDSARIKNLSWDDDYKSLLLDGYSLKGSSVVNITTPIPSITDTPVGTVEYRCTATVEYMTPDDVQWDGTYIHSAHVINLEILLKKKQNGELAVYKVTAVRGD